MSRYDRDDTPARPSRYDEPRSRYDDDTKTPRTSRTRDEGPSDRYSRYHDADDRSVPATPAPARSDRYSREEDRYDDRDRHRRDERDTRELRDSREREVREERRAGDDRYDERTFSRGYGGGSTTSHRDEAPRDRYREDASERHREDDRRAPPSRSSEPREGAPAPSRSNEHNDLPSRPDDNSIWSAYADARAAAQASGARAPSDVGTLSSTLQQQLRLTSFYVRPGYGKEGKKLDVLANFFQVRAEGRAKLIHHYDVEINPVVRVQDQKKPKFLLRAIFEQVSLQEGGEWAKPFSACAYDGRKNCFTPIPFPIKPGQVHSFITALAADNVARRNKDESSSDDESRRFKVEIKHVAVIDLEKVMDFCNPHKRSPSGEEECLTGVMATNVLMRDAPSKKYSQVGATGNRFFTLDGAKPIAHGAIVCRGFMQSFRYSNCGLPLLNIDVGFSAFMSSGPAIDVIAKMIGGRGGAGGRGGHAGGRGGYGGGGGPGANGSDLHELSPEQIRLAKNKLRGMKFNVTHRSSTRLHTIMSITVERAQDISFTMTDRESGKDVKVYVPEYFKEYCGVEVTKPRLPCIQYGKKNFIPLEFVHLADWNSLPPTKLSADQTADMIKVAAIKPKERMTQIMGWREELDYDSQPKIAAWGLQVNKKLIDVPARVLDPPKVAYGNRRTVQPESGNWNLRGNQFFRSEQSLKAWSIISFDRFLDQKDMQRYITYLCQTLRQHGVPIENDTPECFGPIDPRPEGNVESALQQAARSAFRAGKCAPQLICVVLPGRDSWLYERIKKSSFMDLKGPVPTQCMQAAKIRTDRGITAYTGNLAMKIQSKLGGVTHQVPISELPGMIKGKTMLLGADLGHPPVKAGYADAPTVACSIATYSADCDMYSAQIRLQQGRQEIIQELTGMVQAHLEIFRKKNDGELPDRILVFRDGISEGQYAAALNHEHSSIIRACERIEQGYRPKILICICAKRHNTRFFGKDRDLDRSGNLPAGTVIDTAVTHPFAFDFFLQAHAGRVGTARPTHYICLLDELGLTPDQLQKTVNSLCFAFARCTTSVSLVPVCYIADLVCQKARIIVHEPGSSIAPSESSDGRPRSESGMTSTTALRARNAGVDVMQIQKILMRNPELVNVAWWM